MLVARNMAVTETELLEGIAHCLIGEPTPGKMIRLASYIQVKDYIFGDEKPIEIPQSYSMAPPPQEQAGTITTSGNSEFLRAVHGKDSGKIMDVMDELMDSMKVLQPRIYDGVMRRVSEIK